VILCTERWRVLCGDKKEAGPKAKMDLHIGCQFDVEKGRIGFQFNPGMGICYSSASPGVGDGEIKDNVCMSELRRIVHEVDGAVQRVWRVEYDC